METNWIFQEPIDFEHKKYVLLDYIQKVDIQIKNLKLYPNFQQIALHLANISLILEKKQYLNINRNIKAKDDEILISDLTSNDLPPLIENEEIEIYNICKYSYDILKEFFNKLKALWEIVNDSVLIEPLQNLKKINSKEGIFFIKHNKNTYVYEFVIKKIKKGFVDTKCVIKKICIIDSDFDLKNNFINVKNPLIKNINNFEYRKNLLLFKVTHTEQFPFKETLLPITKRKIMNYMVQSKIIKQTVLDKKLLK